MSLYSVLRSALDNHLIAKPVRTDRSECPVFMNTFTQHVQTIISQSKGHSIIVPFPSPCIPDVKRVLDESSVRMINQPKGNENRLNTAILYFDLEDKKITGLYCEMN